MVDKWLEKLDSSYVTVQAVSSALQHRPFLITSSYPKVESLLHILSAFPPAIQRAGIFLGVLPRGISPSVAPQIHLQMLTNFCLNQYPGEKYSAVAVGAPSGALAHFCSLLRIPFLTTHFLFSFRFWNPHLNASRTRDFGFPIAEKILKHNPCLEAVIHFDPIHDRFLVFRLCHIRLRLRCFPADYLGWLKQNLAPDGIVFFFNCTYEWKVKFLAPKTIFQIGGLGDISPDEFIQIFGWQDDWQPYPESEWGTPPSFLNSAKGLLEQSHIPWVEISFPHPQNLSLWVWKLWQNTVSSSEIFLDSFTFIDPYFHLLSRIPPYWLAFNCRDSLKMAIHHLSDHQFQRIYLSLPPSFARNRDIASQKEWSNALSSLGEVIPIGMSKFFPVDAYAAFRRVEELKRWYARLPSDASALHLKEIPQFLLKDKILRL